MSDPLFVKLPGNGSGNDPQVIRHPQPRPVWHRDLCAAGAVLRLAATISDTVIPEVARVVATRGIEAGQDWLAGYWYATGVRQHAVVATLQQMLATEDEDD